MDVDAFFEGMPFAELLGIEVTEAADGQASGRVQVTAALSWSADRVIAHGGVAFALADTVGAAALVSLVERPVPTIDMRIDYLSPGADELRAEASVVRCGADVGVVEVEVVDAAGEHVADARGVYKTG